MLAFDAEGEFVGPFSDDLRIVDPRGLCIDPSGALIYLNSVDWVLALDRSGSVVRDSGPMADLDLGGAVFGPDGCFYVTMRRRRTILGISAKLDGHAEPLLPEGIVPFPRGFGFGRDGSHPGVRSRHADAVASFGRSTESSSSASLLLTVR